MRRIVLISLFILFLHVGGGCDNPAHSESPPAPAADAEKKSINVKVQTLAAIDFDETITLSGGTLADMDIRYSAELAGKLERLAVDLGDEVKAGQVLARIDYEMLKAQSEQAQAAFNLAQKTFARLQTLRSEELISQQQIDEVEAQVIQAESQLKIARANLNKSVVRAANGGVVARKFVEEGEYLGPGTPIVQVVDYRRIIVEAELAESQVDRVRKGDPVSVLIPALGETFPGEVEVVLPASEPVTRTFKLRVKVKNADRRILVGMAAVLRLVVKTHHGVIVVPQEVVIEETGMRCVFIERDGLARRREVALGVVEGSRVVITEGLAPGDRLVVMGQRSLVDGQPVTVVEDLR